MSKEKRTAAFEIGRAILPYAMVILIALVAFKAGQVYEASRPVRENLTKLQKLVKKAKKLRSRVRSKSANSASRTTISLPTSSSKHPSPP